MSSKNKQDKKPKKLITIKYLKEDDENSIEFKIDKSIQPKDYLAFIYSLFNDEAIVNVSKVLDANGHADSENTISMIIAARYLHAMNNLMDKPVVQQEKVNNDEEIIKPSRGIIQE